MKKNIGTKNRIARLVFGSIIAGLSFGYLDSPLDVIGTAIGIFMVIEGALGFCILHTLRGTSDMR